jgi:Glycosyltransferase family 87
VIATKYPLFTRVALVLAWLLGALAALQAVRLGITDRNLGTDAHAYWLVGQGNVVYDKAPGQLNAYLYSPAFAAAVRPLAMLPWRLFLAAWICLETGALLWLLKPLQARWAVPFFLLCIPELVIGNVYLMLAAVAVAGLRRPALWAFPILTKVTPGVGLLWFAFRGEWRGLLNGAAATMLIVCASYLFAPLQWHQWVGFLLNHDDGARDGGVGFAVRCLLAVTLVAVGARTNRAWLIAPAMVLASPASALVTLTMLVAVPRLLELDATRPAKSMAANTTSSQQPHTDGTRPSLAHDRGDRA